MPNSQGLEAGRLTVDEAEDVDVARVGENARLCRVLAAEDEVLRIHDDEAVIPGLTDLFPGVKDAVRRFAVVFGGGEIVVALVEPDRGVRRDGGEQLVHRGDVYVPLPELRLGGRFRLRGGGLCRFRNFRRFRRLRRRGRGGCAAAGQQREGQQREGQQREGQQSGQHARNAVSVYHDCPSLSFGEFSRFVLPLPYHDGRRLPTKEFLKNEHPPGGMTSDGCCGFDRAYLVPKMRSPASPRPGTM